MNQEQLLKLRNYLFEFISENKKQKFLENIEHRTRHVTVVLEDIFQPHNASAVLRSCDLFGVQDVHIIENENEYHVNPHVALGASQWLNLNYYSSQPNNTLDCFETLREKGYKIVATTPHKDDFPIDKFPLDQKFALVYGTEATGLSEVAMNNADAFIKIPMYGFTESFNISVSAALSLYHLTEKLRKSEINWQLSELEKIEIHIEWAKQVIKSADMIIEDYHRKNKIVKA
jgi:tRNA (guanosine-2'-O-)-methyltransferase